MKVNGKDIPGSTLGKCYETHPPLPLGEGLVVYGGSCITPIVKDADVYIGFDHSMGFTERKYPWTEGCEFQFLITDMAAPKDPYQFKKLVEWTAEQIKAGKKVHAGCIGGHGRTGLFFAALVKHMMGVEDAITYVRENYCKKAVESTVQVEFLHTHFGIKKVEGAKLSHSTRAGGTFYGTDGRSMGADGVAPYMPGLRMSDFDKELDEEYFEGGDAPKRKGKGPTQSVFEFEGKKVYSEKAYRSLVDAAARRDKKAATRTPAALAGSAIDNEVRKSREGNVVPMARHNHNPPKPTEAGAPMTFKAECDPKRKLSVWGC